MASQNTLACINNTHALRNNVLNKCVKVSRNFAAIFAQNPAENSHPIFFAYDEGCAPGVSVDAVRRVGLPVAIMINFDRVRLAVARRVALNPIDPPVSGGVVADGVDHSVAGGVRRRQLVSTAAFQILHLPCSLDFPRETC